MGGASPIMVRRATTQDAAAYARMMGDPAVYGGLLQMPFPSEELWAARLAETLAPGKADLALVAERVRALYAAENWRRLALATTSTVAAPSEAPVALRAPSAPLGATIPFDSNLSMLREPPRPYSNFDRAGVSPLIGTRGIAEQLTKPLTRSLRRRYSRRHGDASSPEAVRCRPDIWVLSPVRLHPPPFFQQA